MYLSFETIKACRKHLMFKLNVNKVARLVKLAIYEKPV